MAEKCTILHKNFHNFPQYYLCTSHFSDESYALDFICHLVTDLTQNRHPNAVVRLPLEQNYDRPLGLPPCMYCRAV